MTDRCVEAVLEEVKRWPGDDRMELARSLNRLTAMERTHD